MGSLFFSWRVAPGTGGGINPIRPCHSDLVFVVDSQDERVCFMKRIKEKSKRILKYWRISYQQASERERLFMGVYTLMVLAYVWWAILAL